MREDARPRSRQKVQKIERLSVDENIIDEFQVSSETTDNCVEPMISQSIVVKRELSQSEVVRMRQRCPEMRTRSTSRSTRSRVVWRNSVLLRETHRLTFWVQTAFRLFFQELISQKCVRKLMFFKLFFKKEFNNIFWICFVMFFVLNSFLKKMKENEGKMKNMKKERKNEERKNEERKDEE